MNKSKAKRYDMRWLRHVHRCSELNAVPFSTARYSSMRLPSYMVVDEWNLGARGLDSPSWMK